MKINWILLVISLGISALSGYGFWAGTANALLAAGASLSLLVTLGGTLSVSFGRGGANVKVLSALFFVVFLGENLAFALVGFATAPYVIVTGILLLVYAAAFYGTAKAVKSM